MPPDLATLCRAFAVVFTRYRAAVLGWAPDAIEVVEL